MRRSSLTLTFVLALLVGVSVTAPTVIAQDTEGEHPIVGAWAGPSGNIVFLPGGSAIGTDPYGGTVVGSWQPTGERSADLTVRGADATPGAAPGSTVIARATSEVAEDGTTAAATATVESLAPDGGSSGQLGPITESLQRLTVEPMGEPVGPIPDAMAGASPMPSAAQAEEGSPPPEGTGASGPVIDVVGVDYAYQDLPTSVPAGTTLTFANDGTEVHEMVVVKISDETTPLEELMAMPEEETAGISEFVGFLSAFPGTTADGSVIVAAPGRYVVVCNIHEGSDPAAFEALGFDPSQIDMTTDPSTLPPEVQELLAEIESNPAHLELGMIQEVIVTSSDSSPGPMPDAPASPMTE